MSVCELDLHIPSYLRKPDTTDRYYGTLVYEEKTKSWIIEGEPCVIEMAKRLFPGCKGRGGGIARFKSSKRINGDLNWLMLRYPLQIQEPERWEQEFQETIEHVVKREQILRSPQKAKPLHFNGQLTPFQEEGLAFLLHNRKCLLADDMGLGKAQPLDAKILTPNGWKLMGQIRIGDEIINSKGGISRVTGVYPQGEKEIYQIEFTDGSKTECCMDHLWCVNSPSRKWRGYAPRILSLREIVNSISHKNGNLKHFIPMIKPVEFREQALSIEPYLLGLLIGNGGFSTNQLRFTTSDAELLKHVARNIPKGVSLKQVGKYDYAIKGEKAGQENPVIKLLKGLGLWGHKSGDKFIPKEYLYASAASRISLLQGLMDTDGSVSENHLEYTSKSKTLAENVAEIIQSLGGTARIKRRKSKWTHNGLEKTGFAYRVSISLPNGIQPFRLKRKADQYKPRLKYEPTRAIKKVTYVGKKQAQCIMVDAPDHLYITDGYILTHNTVQALAFLSTLQAYPALLVVPAHLILNWKKEMNRFITPPIPTGKNLSLFDNQEETIHVIKGRKPYALPPASIYIIHYHLLAWWKDVLSEKDFEAIIFDEIQDLRHAGTQKYSAASLLSDHCQNVIGLSGTPIYNKGGEIWNVMNIIEFHCLGDWESFTREWCVGYGSVIVEKPDLLGDYLKREGLLLRRTKDQVLTELPPKRRIVQTIDFEADKYDDLIQNAILLAKRMDDVKDQLERGRMTREIVNTARQATGIAKAPFVAQFVKLLLDAGEKVLLFAFHHAVFDTYMEELDEYNPVKITGRESSKEKENAVEKFMTDQTNICLISLRAAAGLNLQKANCVVFGELDWSPAIHSQAEDRAHRMGQKDSVLCYYLVSNTGSDEDIQEALGLKVSQFIGLMGDKAETEEDRMMNQVAAQEHMTRIVEKLKNWEVK